MKKIILLTIGVALCTIRGINAQTPVNGDINGTWDVSGSPYQITDSSTVKSGQTLTIESGVTVEFQKGAGLYVFGKITAVGAAGDSITFTAIDTAKGIVLDMLDDTAKFNYCRIENFKNTGAMHILDHKVKIENAHFTNNLSYAGGAITIYDKNPIIKNSLFDNNNADSLDADSEKAGAILITGDASPVIMNNTFKMNQALRGGAIGITCSVDTPIIANNLFVNNVAGRGGAIFIGGDDTTVAPNIYNNIIKNNTGTYDAGGIATFGNSAPNIVNNLIINNQAEGIKVGSASKPVIINNTVVGNTGGGILLSCEEVKRVIYNCIIYNNSSFQISTNSGSPTVHCINCLIENGEDGISNEGSVITKNLFTGNPDFTDADNDDYSLTSTSICINSGIIDTIGSYIPATDLAGNNRNYNTIDIGAYEFQGDPDNRLPNLLAQADVLMDDNSMTELTVQFTDSDAGDNHTITIESSNADINIQNKSGDTTNSTYEIHPSADWTGIGNIYVKVTDNSGTIENCNTDTFTVYVLDSIYQGNVSGTWDDVSNVYFIGNDITIPSGEKLTINPGVNIKISENSRIIAYGSIQAKGSSTDPVSFSAFDPNKPWGGIKINPDATPKDSIVFDYCEISQSGQEGGLYIFDTINIRVQNSKIFNNYASSCGGGIFIKGDALIKDNEIYNNKTDGYGGGILLANGSGAVIENNDVHENQADEGGGIKMRAGNNALIKGNKIHNNSANQVGGILCGGDSDSTIIMNNIISNNNSKSGASGVKIAGNAAPLLVNNIICNNEATISFGGKGAAIQIASESSPKLYNNTIAFNKNNGTMCGGIFSSCRSDSVVIVNNIVYFNETAGNVDNPQVYLKNNSNPPSFLNNNIQGGLNAFNLDTTIFIGTYTDNIDSDPLFVDPTASAGNSNDGLTADWSLGDASECIDVGEEVLPANMPTIDYAGNERIINSTIDIGAIEFKTSSGDDNGGSNGINETTSSGIKVYPVPANQLLNINLYSDLQQNGLISIINLNGKTIFNKQIYIVEGENMMRIDVSGFKTGIYILKLSTQNTAKTKFIIIR